MISIQEIKVDGSTVYNPSLDTVQELYSSLLGKV